MEVATSSYFSPPVYYYRSLGYYDGKTYTSTTEGKYFKTYGSSYQFEVIQDCDCVWINSGLGAYNMQIQIKGALHLTAGEILGTTGYSNKVYMVIE